MVLIIVCRYADLDGNNRDILMSQLQHVYALSVFENYVYWVDWNTKSIEKANRLTGLNRTTIKNMSMQPYDIHVVHSLLQDTTGKLSDKVITLTKLYGYDRMTMDNA